MAEYVSLINGFLCSAIDAIEFRDRLIGKFKNEKDLPEREYVILDQLFADADCFTEDSELLASRPDFYISSDQLKERATEALAALGKP
ncbi:colicin immunity domain-containing protein [Luteimonas suaedae]|uniref:colicin immunity domain-containing protein n=1 Tax=Luteimonas suaedae TaxID=2605430 RepID=UPI001659D8ED|nr:colicin immunity domain-containing protein [Luteimonas suaedae]